MNAFVVALLALLCAVATLAYSGLLSIGILKLPGGNSAMQEIAEAIQEGANAYLGRQTKTLAVVGLAVFFLIWGGLDHFHFPYIALCFAVGASFSVLAGIIGMNVSVRANVRTAQAAEKGLSHAMDVAFKGGTVTGLAVVALALLGLAGFFVLYVVFMERSLENYLSALVGYGFGGSLISLFARVGGGIYTKAADVGGDLVGKVIAGLPEDDPRNPAAIADNVGDNVGDCAGMGADLFETYGVTLIAAMLLGVMAFQSTDEDLALRAMLLPLALGAAALIASIIASWFVKLPARSTRIMGALYKGTFAAVILSAGSFFMIARSFFPLNTGRVFFPALVGLGVLVGLTLITEYYTSTAFRPVKYVAAQSASGAATNIISGLAVGFQSTLAPVLVICAGILLAYWSGGGADSSVLGVYGIAIAATSMLSSCGIVVAIDAFGPITDNAGGIAEMAQLPPEYREVTDALDAVGNTTKAVTKGYAIGSAGLAALVLFVAYTQEIDALLFQAQRPPLTYVLSDPKVLVGLFLGGMLPFFFSSLFMNSVSKAATAVIAEVRRQFDEIDGLMAGRARPEYGRCVDIVTQAALKEMILPGVLAICAPLAVGLLLGPIALGGLLVGAILTGLLLALFMSTAGATWDNAKKYVEIGNFGGPNSEAHKAAVVGDTVGDPFKDTAGPALNPMIKILNIVALLIVGFIYNGSLLGF